MTSLPPDPYKALGVSKEAQIAEIRTAYRKLVLKCHPDKVQDPALKAQKAEEFQKVQQAYELLNNEKERQRYDDQVRLHELKEQMRAAKAAATRAPQTYKVDIRTAEPRPTTFKSSSPPTRGYESFSRSYEGSSGRSFDDSRTPPRRESSYSDKPSKAERERERERRDKEKERERRKKEKADDSARRAEKEAKEAKRAEKKLREKLEEKERRRNGEDKKQRHSDPYIEGYDDEPPKSEKKRSSKKHDSKRDRSSHREEVPQAAPPPMPPMPQQERSYTAEKEDFAASYIAAANKKSPAYMRTVAPPTAPTPPPVPGQSGPFSPPPIAVAEEPETHRSTKSRRGSSGEKSSYNKKTSSREVLVDPDVVGASPSARHAQRSATAAAMATSPPRLGRQNTAPAEFASRPIPTMARASTYAGYAEDPRGRGRSRLQPQVEESESEDDYEHERRQHRKHKSKKHRSPERPSEYKYKVSDGRATLQSSYGRSLEQEPSEYAASYHHYAAGPTNIHVVETRPSISEREPSYSSRSAASSFPKYKVSKSYDYGDIAYSQSNYPPNSYHEEYSAYA